MANTGEILGTKNKNLILETAGKLYIKVNDRYYDIDFRNLSSGNLVGTKVKTVHETISQEPAEEIDLSDYITSASLKRELKKYVTDRTFQDVMKTQEAIQDAKLQGFTESITPVTIQTMSIAVGQDQLQFDIVQSLENDLIGDSPLYIDENPDSLTYGQLMFKPCSIKHYTLDGPKSVTPGTGMSEYWRWYILNTNQSNSIETLSIDNSTYYVYMVVPYKELSENLENSEPLKGIAPYVYLNSSGEETPKTIGANLYKDTNDNLVFSPNASGMYYKTGVGYLKVVEEAIAYDELASDGYYHLLYAIITNTDGDPSWTTMNGFTEITPGQIRAYLFSSNDGASFLNLQKSEFQLAKRSKNSNGETVNDVALHFDPENGLSLKGRITVLGGSSYTDKNGNTQLFEEQFDTILNKITNVQNQVDGAIETYYYEGPPNSSSKPESDWINPDIRENHVGDLYYDKESGKAYRYMGEGDPRQYSWVLITDTDITTALKQSENALSVADGKSKTWLTQPTPPYSSGDMWITDKDYKVSETVTYKKGELLVCTLTVPEKTEDGVKNEFSWNNWTKATHYTSPEDLEKFQEDYTREIEKLNLKIDKKVETYASETDPSTEWDNNQKELHIGDLWLNTGKDKIGDVESGQSAIWDGEAWVPTKVPDAIFDKIDGKKDIFVTSGEGWDTPPTPPYKKGDLWISQAPESSNGYSETYVCINDSVDGATVGNKSDWVPASDAKEYIDSKYTELNNKFGEYNYLKEALKGTTTIEGGLILSSLIGLGTWTQQSDGTFTLDQVMSGINGQIDSELGDRSIAAWYGGLMFDKEEMLSTDVNYSNCAKTLFRHDGSGYLANGNISFTKNGTLNFGAPDSTGTYNLSINSAGVVSIGGSMKIYGSNTDINHILSELSDIKNNMNEWFTLDKDKKLLTTKYTLVSNLGFASAVALSASEGVGGLIFDGNYDTEWDADLYAHHATSARLGKVMWDAIKSKVSTPVEIFGSSAIGSSTSFMYWDGSSLRAAQLGSLAFSNATIPTSTSDLTNNSGYITSTEVASTYLTQSDASETYLTLSSAKAAYLLKTGGTMTGPLAVASNLSVAGTSSLNKVKIGKCTLEYDTSNECLKFTF